MKMRFLGAFLALIIVLPAIIYVHLPTIWVMLGFLSLLCTYEFLSIVRLASGISAPSKLQVFWIWLQGALLLIGWKDMSLLMGMIYGLLCLKMLERALMPSEKQERLIYITEPLECFVYTIFPLFAVKELFVVGEGNGLVWFLCVTIWLTDIGAYFVGKSLGRRKLAPHLSPNKTREGAWGGIIVAIAGNLALTKIPGGYNPYHNLTLSFILAATPLISVAGQLGDLFESWLKRRANVKDSGRFLPGHGGALDRLDSIIFAAPLLLCLVKVMMGL